MVGTLKMPNSLMTMLWLVIAAVLLPVVIVAMDMVLNPPNSPSGPNKLYPFSEVVLAPGMKVVAENKTGKFSIEYVDEVRRKFSWDNRSEIVKMIPREERFLGKLGIYNPASAWGWDPRIRIVAQEEQLHFNSQEETQKWLIQGSAYMDWVYTNDGLVAGFGLTPERNQVSIDLYQIFINGKRPEHLDGSRPDKIRLDKIGSGKGVRGAEKVSGTFFPKRE